MARKENLTRRGETERSALFLSVGCRFVEGGEAYEERVKV